MASSAEAQLSTDLSGVRLRGVPYVLQMHGMIDSSTRRSARVLDVVATRRTIAASACVFVLTPREKADIATLMRGKDFVPELLSNGIRTEPIRSNQTTSDEQVEVLYCSRLHQRKRPRAFVQAALDLLAEGVKAKFVLIGPDEGNWRRLKVY